MEMNVKNRMKKVLVCGLCVTMLVGCSNDKEALKRGKDVNVSNSISKVTTQIKAKYAASNKVEFAEPMYNLKENHVFKYDDLGEGFFDNDGYDCFAVFSDSNLKQRVDITVDSDYDKKTATIAPNLVFSYEDKEGSCNVGTWGTRSKFWLVQYVNTQTGKVLDKPLITIFTITQELTTPTLEQGIGENGCYELKWSEVEGADYYEVYEYTEGVDFALLEVTTEKTSCQYDEFETAIGQQKRFREKYGDTEIDVNNKWMMNSMMDLDKSYFVVAKNNDGEHSGMSNECKVSAIGKEIPQIVSDDFKKEYEGESSLVLPTYVDVRMLDGSVGKFLIDYHGAETTLYDDGRIIINATIKNLPISMLPMELSGMDYDTFLKDVKQVIEREDALVTKSVTSDQKINIPFVPEKEQETPQVEEEEKATKEPVEDEEKATKEPVEEKKVDNNTLDLNVSDEVSKMIYANTALSEWIALNLLDHNEKISMVNFPECSDTDYFMDAIMEAYTQNPLCGIISKVDYDYKTNNLLVGYVLSSEETENMQKDSLAKAKEIATEIIKDGMTSYEKEEAINQYLCENASYNEKIMEYIKKDGTIDEKAVLDFANSFTPYGVLVENLGVCESYAEAFLLIAKAAGLEAVIETGKLNGVNHEWNRVNIDGAWYTLDVTNNDSEYLPNCYFNLSDEVAATILLGNGNAYMDNYISNYTASDMKNEYYTKNNLYTNDASEAVSMLVDVLSDNDVSVVRMDQNYGNSGVENIIKEVINKAKLTKGKYYYNAGVISILK